MTDLLSMIITNVKANNGECYTNEMYIRAEKHLQKKDAEKRRNSQMKRDKELQAIEDAIRQRYLREQAKTLTKTADEFDKYCEEIFERKRKELIEKYERETAQEMIRDTVRNELERNRDGLGTFWNVMSVINSYLAW